MIISVESINQLCNRSLTDRTQDSDSCNVGSIPAGCIFFIFLKSEKSSKIKGLRAFCCFINAEKILFSAP